MTNRSFEQRSARRSRLIGLLRSEDYWTTAALREQLRVSQRTLMRELSGLREAGYPIESDRGRGGGIRLSGNWGIERLNLSHSEIIELILSLAVMETLQSPLLTSNVTSIKQKLFQAFPEKQRAAVSNIRKRIMIGDNANANVVSQYSAPPARISEPVAESFLTRIPLEIEYESERGERTARVIEAQYILLNWPIWYILAWDHLRDSSRVFRIDRIQTAQLAEGSFQVRNKDSFTDIYQPFYKTI